MELRLRNYQQDTHDKTIEALKSNDKVLVQLPTGAGKSINIGFLANHLKGRTLILCHRIEILNQNSEWINDVGVLTASVKKNEPLKKNQRIISMSQTIHARFKKYNSDYVGKFDNVIIDEVHFEIFKKVYDQLNFKKLISYTATPILNKTETKLVDDIEFTRTKSFGSEYDVLVQGVSERELIDLGYLTEDMNIQLTPPNLEQLKNSNTNDDGYTSASLTEVFGSRTSVENVYKGYSKYAVGKKSMIFTPTTSTNLEVYNYFKEKGVNCRMFDSVNKSDLSRKETVEWFNSQKDAVLINTNVFTTGFDSKEVEVIILNRKTKSLSLLLQMMGRGSRVSDKIFKDRFLVIDLALNIETHGRWSKERDWSKYFKPQQWKKKQESDLLQVWECKKCGEYNLVGEVFNQELDRIECGGCGEPKPARKEPKKIKGKFVVLDDPPIPSATRIISYVKRTGGDGNMVFRLFKKQVVDLFIYHTDEPHYIKNQGRYKQRIAALFRPVYFAVLNDKELKGKNRRLNTELEGIYTKIDKIYIK